MIPLIYGIGDGRYTSCVSDHAYKRRGITELLYNVGSCSLAESADDGGSFYEVALPIRVGAPYAFRGDLLGAVTGVDGFDLFFDFF